MRQYRQTGYSDQDFDVCLSFPRASGRQPTRLRPCLSVSGNDCTMNASSLQSSPITCYGNAQNGRRGTRVTGLPFWTPSSTFTHDGFVFTAGHDARTIQPLHDVNGQRHSTMTLAT
jgi:hypothetical protein